MHIQQHFFDTTLFLRDVRPIHSNLLQGQGQTQFKSFKWRRAAQHRGRPTRKCLLHVHNQSTQKVSIENYSYKTSTKMIHVFLVFQQFEKLVLALNFIHIRINSWYWIHTKRFLYTNFFQGVPISFLYLKGANYNLKCFALHSDTQILLKKISNF